MDFRRTAGFAASMLAMTVLSGCGGGSPAPAAEVVATYDSLAEDLLAAAGTVRPLEWEHVRQGIEEPGAADCRYRPGTWQADETLYTAPGQGMDWRPWRDALDPVLEEHGFDPLGRERRRGAQFFLESDGPHGAHLMLIAQGELRIHDVRVDAAPCEDTTIGL